MVRKFLGILLSPLFYVFFGLCLVIFHPIQWFSLKTGGYSLHKKSVDILNLFLLRCYHLLFNTVKFENNQNLPEDRPIIFVSNHQSQYDIPPLIYFLRKYHGKFISKIELTKGIPSISFNLKYGGGANIDRKNSDQAKSEIAQFAQRMKTNTWSAFIFPEGTRTKTGEMKEFAIGGIATLIEKVPNALIVPVAISGSFQMTQFGIFPLRPFTRMKWTVLPPVELVSTHSIVESIKKIEYSIRKIVENK